MSTTWNAHSFSVHRDSRMVGVGVFGLWIMLILIGLSYQLSFMWSTLRWGRRDWYGVATDRTKVYKPVMWVCMYGVWWGGSHASCFSIRSSARKLETHRHPFISQIFFNSWALYGLQLRLEPFNLQLLLQYNKRYTKNPDVLLGDYWVSLMYQHAQHSCQPPPQHVCIYILEQRLSKEDCGFWASLDKVFVLKCLIC